MIQGDPQDGWTLVSWDGTPIGPANLPTELFVDLRDLITEPEPAKPAARFADSGPLT